MVVSDFSWSFGTPEPLIYHISWPKKGTTGPRPLRRVRSDISKRRVWSPQVWIFEIENSINLLWGPRFWVEWRCHVSHTATSHITNYAMHFTSDPPAPTPAFSRCRLWTPLQFSHPNTELPSVVEARTRENVIRMYSRLQNYRQRTAGSCSNKPRLVVSLWKLQTLPKPMGGHTHREFKPASGYQIFDRTLEAPGMQCLARYIMYSRTAIPRDRTNYWARNLLTAEQCE